MRSAGVITAAAQLVNELAVRRMQEQHGAATAPTVEVTVGGERIGEHDFKLRLLVALVAQKQNEDMKRVSGWAAILFTPSLVGAIYGMNFESIPELTWDFGYPLSILAMVIISAGLYAVFRRQRWL